MPRAVPIIDRMQGSFLGPEYTNEQITQELDALACKYENIKDGKKYEVAAKLLAAGEPLAYFNGRMEFGPRALGNRSILADARLPNMQNKLNMDVKFRESFRPFAPAVLETHYDEWFELGAPSSYMLFTAEVKKSKRGVSKPVNDINEIKQRQALIVSDMRSNSR